jgi:hypothetical protein
MVDFSIRTFSSDKNSLHDALSSVAGTKLQCKRGMLQMDMFFCFEASLRIGLSDQIRKGVERTKKMSRCFCNDYYSLRINLKKRIDEKIEKCSL